MNSANILYQQRLYLNALEYYKRLEDVSPSNYLGLTYLRVGEYTSAYSWLGSALKENPENPIFMVNYGLACWLFSVGS